MFKKQGVVVKVDGNYAWVAARSGCASSGCSVRDCCSSYMAEGRSSIYSKCTIKAVNDFDLFEGDHVIIAILEEGVLRASVLVYSFLLVFLLAAVAVSAFFKLSDFLALIVCIAGLLVGLMVLARVSKKYCGACGVKVVGVVATQLGSSASSMSTSDSSVAIMSSSTGC